MFAKIVSFVCNVGLYVLTRIRQSQAFASFFFFWSKTAAIVIKVLPTLLSTKKYLVLFYEIFMFIF